MRRLSSAGFLACATLMWSWVATTAAGGVAQQFSARKVAGRGVPGQPPWHSSTLSHIDVYILALDRLEHLSQTAASVAEAARQTSLRTNIHFHIDVSCAQADNNPVMNYANAFVQSWPWGSGQAVCVNGSAPGGILAQWARVPPAASATQAVLVVEDDVVLAPGALVALASLWGSVAPASATATAGVSLHHLGYSAREGRHFDASFCHSVMPTANTGGVSTFRSPVVSTWAFSPHPVAWGAFTRWLIARGIVRCGSQHCLELEAEQGALQEMTVDTRALETVLVAAADSLHSAQAARHHAEGADSPPPSAPYASLLWGMEDIRGGRGHQIWSAAFHAFSVLSAGLADPAHTWAYETVYPCFPLAPDGKSQVAALHMKATGVHHSNPGAQTVPKGTQLLPATAARLAKPVVTPGRTLDWFGGTVHPLLRQPANEATPPASAPASRRAAGATAPAGVPASTAFNRGAPGSLTTPSGAAMNKVAHASDDIARTLQSMAWRGIASPFGSMLTRGHDYLEALRGRTIVFFGDSTDRRTLAALYDLVSMGRYHLSLDFDGGCYAQPLTAPAYCRTNSSATHMNLHGDSDWMRMRFSTLDLTVGFCLLRIADPVQGKVRPIPEHVQGCAAVQAQLLGRPGVVAVVNGWMHFLKQVKGPSFVDKMAGRVAEMVHSVHLLLPPKSAIIVRSPLPFHDGHYPRLSAAASMSSLEAWAGVREKLKLDAPGRNLIEWDVFTPFFQASSSNAFKHSKTTDGMHPGAASAFAASILLIELLQTELPVKLPARYAVAALPAWEMPSNATSSPSQVGAFNYDQCPDCDCRFECRFWGGVKQDGDCGNGTRNGTSSGAPQLWSADPWFRDGWADTAPVSMLVLLVLLGCLLGLYPAAALLGAADAHLASLKALLVLMCVCVVAECGNRFPPALELLSDTRALLFTPIAVCVLLLVLHPTLPAADASTQPPPKRGAAAPLCATQPLTSPAEAAELERLVQDVLVADGEGAPSPGEAVGSVQRTSHATPPADLAQRSQPQAPVRDDTAAKQRTGPKYALQRDLTEEWKGWMQLWFLLYHVLRAEAAYPYIRWTVSAYVFLTGYGNTLYYFGSGKVSTKRIAGMLLRMCLFSVLLAGATGTPWYLYYIPFLHAVHYITTTAACLLAMQLQGRFEAPLGFLHASAVVCALLPGVLLETQVGSDMVGIVLQTVFGPTGGTYLLMRLRLDRYSSAVGILGALVVLAANAHAASAPRGKPAGVWAGLCDGILGRWHTARQVIAAALVTAGVAVAVTHPLRAEYKLVNAYVGTLWIPAYLELRLRVLPRLQRWMAGADAQAQLKVHVSRVLAWFGRHSLECYLLQFHLLMTASAGAILVLFPQAPLVSLLLQAVLYLSSAKLAFVATDSLRQALAKHFWLVLAASVACVVVLHASSVVR